MAREQYQVEAVFDLVDAIFDGNARHGRCSSIAASGGCRAEIHTPARA